MSIQIVIPTKVLYFNQDQFEDWVSGKRDSCLDPYCRRLPNSYGFGEWLVGREFESMGYKWIHHDFTVFGGNKLGKYPLADNIMQKFLGEKKFLDTRNIYKVTKNFEEPDLLIYKPDFSVVRFAESKRFATRDKLRQNQVRGLAMLKLILGCEVEVYEIVKEGIKHEAKPIIWTF